MNVLTLEPQTPELKPGSEGASPTPLEEATRFLQALDPDSESKWTFQTLNDDKSPSGSGLISTLHGDLEDNLDRMLQLNEQGAGVFVCPNETDGSGRRTAANITRVRALFIDLDGTPLESVLTCGVEPHVILETSPGHWHAYWRIDHCPLEQFGPIQRALAEKFGGDSSVSDLPRIMRLPGFKHNKDRNQPFDVHIVRSAQRPPYKLDELIEKLHLNLRKAETRALLTFMPSEILKDRNNTLFASARRLRDSGLGPDAALAALQIENGARCKAPLDESEVAGIVKSAFSRTPYGQGAPAVQFTTVTSPTIDGVQLLADISTFVRRFVCMSNVQHDANVLWIAHTWVLSAADSTPYLHVSSAEKASGKTRLIEVDELLVREPMRCANATPAALFRSIQDGERTILFDEIDTIFGSKAREHRKFSVRLRPGRFRV